MGIFSKIRGVLAPAPSFADHIASVEAGLAVGRIEPSDSEGLEYTAATGRSGQWPRQRASYLVYHNFCVACGGTESLNVHHKKPFHLYPDLELVPANFITLCEAGVMNCHFVLGHARNWKHWNPEVEKDAATFSALWAKIKRLEQTGAAVAL